LTGSAIEKVFNKIKKDNSRLSGFVSATGSACTIGTGGYLKEVFPQLKIVGSEALQCPTLLMNCLGGHRIVGIGDDVLQKLSCLGISSISNVLSSIKLAKWFETNENDLIFTGLYRLS
jgi:cysteine synthase A